MTDFVYRVRPGQLEDSLKIWQIRNSFSSRQNSNEQQEIPYQDHQLWFQKKYFTEEKNKLFVITVNDEVTGYLRFDLDKGAYVVAIALDPRYQGQGLGFALLAEGLKRANLPAPITAQVKRHNPASLKLFQKCGFKPHQEDEENYYLKL